MSRAPPYLVWRHVAHGNGVPVPSGALLRTAAARRVGGFEAQAFPGMYDDESFFAKVLLQGRAWVHATPLYRYRQHPDSYCARAIAAGSWNPARDADSPDRRRFLAWLDATCAAAPLPDTERARVREAIAARLAALVPTDA